MQKDGSYVVFQSVDFGVNSDISVGEDGLHLGECVFRQSYFFLYACVASGFWCFCDAQVLKDAYLFYSFPFAKNVTYRNVWLFWDDHALILFAFSSSPLFSFSIVTAVRIFWYFAAFLPSQRLTGGGGGGGGWWLSPQSAGLLVRRSRFRSLLWLPAPYWLGRCQYNVTGWDRSQGLPALSSVWQHVKLSDVSLVTRLRYSLVVDEDVRKPH